LRAEPADAIEAEGIARATRARDIATVTIVVLDRSRDLNADDFNLLEQTASSRRMVVANKCDLTPRWEAGWDAVEISARTGDGLDVLRARLATALGGAGEHRDAPAITNVRHADLIARARATLNRAAVAAAGGTPEEFVLADLHDARALLEEVTGARTAEDVLANIFENFCIGK
jgi:tRNA modification GTPase